jgi:hypothetical protein
MDDYVIKPWKLRVLPRICDPGYAGWKDYALAEQAEAYADRGDRSAERGERDGLNLGSAAIQHAFKASARIGQRLAAAD